MDYKDLTQFLQKQGLFDQVSKNSFYFQTIFEQCLKVKKEKILLIGDLGREKRLVAPLTIASYYYAAKRLNLDVDLVIQDPKEKGAKAGDNVKKALANLPKNSVIVMAVSNKLGSIKPVAKSFRGFIKDKGHRFVSSPSLGSFLTKKFDAFISAIKIDYTELRKKQAVIKKIFDKGSEVKVTSPAGTDFTFSIKGIKAISADGYYPTAGTGGNIPAGEIYMAPEGKNVNGKIVIDGSMRDHEKTRLIKKPIILTVEDGTVTSIEGDKEAKWLEKSLQMAEDKAKYKWGIRRLSEFGLGLNPGASVVGSTLIDEKALGTAHIAMGSNYWFGGNIYAIIHYDQVFMNPSIYIDGELLEL
jgi:leucyl aminopeptidase (aminopeptidase T)